eukprot:TRINITY_DN27876_c0_g1_i1.p1 TRINITY_DN27876_c0_g1~~TRINITY_DN27876_c0_g1_i1.p1  ORF type:complete len:271 (-),score=44.93 TRINITY_DN27876_c0_g1_i1:103-915(-)
MVPALPQIPSYEENDKEPDIKRFISTRTKTMCGRSPINVSTLSYRLQSFPFFKRSDPLFLDLLASELSIRIFEPRQKILAEGDLGQLTYILFYGDVEVYQTAMLAPIRVCAPALFGETPLLTHGPAKRKATVVARTICDCRVIHQRIFNQLLSHFPTERLVYKKMAEERAELAAQEADKIKEKEKKDEPATSKSVPADKDAEQQDAADKPPPPPPWRPASKIVTKDVLDKLPEILDSSKEHSYRFRSRKVQPTKQVRLLVLPPVQAEGPR